MGVRLPNLPPLAYKNDPVDPGDEMLYGARAIAKFLFGNERFDRRVYHLVATGRLPVARIPGFAARKSTLRRWLERQEYMSTSALSRVAA
jgi:hypothetical protein